MVEIIRPYFKDRLGLDYFARRADLVACDILGRTLVRQLPRTSRELIVRIKEVSAWEGEERSSSPGLKYAPGMVGVSQKYGNLMLDIATNDHRIASCITLVALETPKGVIQGPGRVAEYLKIDKDFDSMAIDQPGFWISGQPVETERIQVRKKKNSPGNCVGYFYFK